MFKREKDNAEKKESQFLVIVKRLSKNPNAVFGMVLLLILVIGVIFVPMISPYEYSKMDVRAINQGPTAAHWFGTDDMGRDQLTRIFYGGRYSLSISMIAVLVSTTIGMVIGAVAGYFGGALDNVLMRLIDIVLSIPPTCF